MFFYMPAKRAKALQHVDSEAQSLVDRRNWSRTASEVAGLSVAVANRMLLFTSLGNFTSNGRYLRINNRVTRKLDLFW